MGIFLFIVCWLVVQLCVCVCFLINVSFLNWFQIPSSYQFCVLFFKKNHVFSFSQLIYLFILATYLPFSYYTHIHTLSLIIHLRKLYCLLCITIFPSSSLSLIPSTSTHPSLVIQQINFLIFLSPSPTPPLFLPYYLTNLLKKRILT